jgi:hypothetical protein
MNYYKYTKLFSRLIIAGIVLCMYIHLIDKIAFNVGMCIVFCCLSFFVFEDFFKKEQVQ